MVLVKLSSELDVCTSFSLMESIADAITERPALIAVDLGDALFTVRPGVDVPENAAHHMDARRTRFAVICLSSRQLMRVLAGGGPASRALHPRVDG